MIIQAIAMLDQLDKDVSLFVMRIREWYEYHFPELVKIVSDHNEYTRVALFTGDKDTSDKSKLSELQDLLEGDTTRHALKIFWIALEDLLVQPYPASTHVILLVDCQKSLANYLAEKMNSVAPSLTGLLGGRVGDSTVYYIIPPILVELALNLRHKYHGILSTSARLHLEYLDGYSDNPTSRFGDALRQQLGERLSFFETGQAPTKKSEAMREVLESLSIDDDNENADDERDEDISLPLIEPSLIEETEKRRYGGKVDGEDDNDNEPPKKKQSKEENEGGKEKGKG